MGNVISNLTKKLSNVVKETLELLKQDAVYGIRLGKAKIKEIKMEQKKLQKLIEIGRKTYFLYKKGLIKNQQLQKICKEMEILEGSAKIYHTMAQEYKDKIKL